MSDENPEIKFSREPFRRSDVPFLESAAAQNAIKEIVDGRGLTIYVGAGATIDSGGPSWDNLVRQLLERLLEEEGPSNTLRFPEDIKSLATACSALEIASIVESLYEEAHPIRDSHTLQELRQAIVSLTYPRASTDGGQLTRAIAELAIEAARYFKKVNVMTTNYESILEEELKDLVGKDIRITRHYYDMGNSRPSTSRGAGVHEKSSNRIDIHYLHGMLAKEGEPRGELIFSESEYLKFRGTEAEILEKFFKQGCLLIVGASLTDPPLLSSLHDTAKKHDGRRFALFPVQSLASNFSQPTIGQIEAVRRGTTQRFESYDLTVLFPDYYSQCSWYCREIASSLRKRQAGSEDLVFRPYHRRLQEWSRIWTEKYFVETKGASLSPAEKRVNSDTGGGDSGVESLVVQNLDAGRHEIHVALRSGLERLALQFQASEITQEAWKIELWARILVDGDHRSLSVVGSSTTVMMDDRVRRTVPLSIRSRFPAIKAYCDGRAYVWRRGESDTSDASENPDLNRWDYSRTIPVMLFDHQGSIPVGCVSLVAMNRTVLDLLSARDRQRIDEELVTVAQLIFTTGDYKTNPVDSLLSLDNRKL